MSLPQYKTQMHQNYLYWVSSCSKTISSQQTLMTLYKFPSKPTSENHTTRCCFVIDMLISTQYSPSGILEGALFVM